MAVPRVISGNEALTTGPSEAKRWAETQCLFREINERLLELNEAFDLLTERRAVICECASLACVVQIEVRPEEYEQVREHGDRFLVAPSRPHVVPEAEDVVGAHGRYFVVQKRGEAGTIALDRNPRS
jgi:hypothetical protein